jgi:hypothetical protein
MKHHLRDILNGGAARVAKDLAKAQEELAKDGQEPALEEVIARVKKNTSQKPSF